MKMKSRIIGAAAGLALLGGLAGGVAAAPNPDSAAGQCAQGPGHVISQYAKLPGSNNELVTWGQAVKEQCAPGQQ